MVEIRKAYPTDAYTLVSIRDSAWRNIFYDVLSNEIIYDKQKNMEDSVRHLRDQIEENNRILVAVDGEKIVGFVFYAKTQGDHYENAEIREIYVLPEYQKRGIGKMLFDGASEALRKLKYNSFIVACPIKNPNIEFFTHLGGVKKSVKDIELYGKSVECEVIYYDILDDVKETNGSDEWNKLYMRAQDEMVKLNERNPEVAILLTDKGNMYVGLAIENVVCPIESALSNMYLGGENKIDKILIMDRKSNPVLPCGKCRDLLIRMKQESAVILFDYGSLRTMTMKELNPYYKDIEII